MNDETPNARVPKRKAAERNGVSVRTISRWENDPELGFPRPIIINKRCYYDEAELRQWERSRERKVA
jgi:hypothetical protein